MLAIFFYLQPSTDKTQVFGRFVPQSNKTTKNMANKNNDHYQRDTCSYRKPPPQQSFDL